LRQLLLINRNSIDNFLLHASEFGFFLNTDRFRHSALFASIPEERPMAVLLASVRLLGVHISGTNDIAAHEPMLLSNALREISLGLQSNHPKWILHMAQAEVLLAQYFFRSSRIIEGKYHCSAAVSLCIGNGLHKIRSIRAVLPEVRHLDNLATPAPAPQDAVEEGEMINGFWTIFVLDKCWSASLGTPSLISDDDTLGAQIDTPWPLDMSGYEEVSNYGI
jgi:Fungal specific transcription factor domain